MNKTRLGDCCEFILDGTHGSPVRAETGVPVLSAQNVMYGKLSFETDRFTSLDEYEAFRRRLDVRPSDVLLTIVGTIGRVAIVTEQRPLVLQRSVAVLRPKQGVLLPKYLFYALQQPSVKAQLARSTNQSSQAGIYLGKLKEVEISLPPLDDQQGIAAVLDKADALREKRQQAINKLERLLQAVFLDMFGGEKLSYFVTASPKVPTHPRGWSWVKLTDVARLATGHTPSRRVEEYWKGEIPWISLTDIRRLDGKVASGTSEYVTEEGIKNSSSVKLPPRTVCFSRTASVGFVTMMGREMATSQDFVNWVCGESLNPTYLMWALIFSRKQLKALSTGSTHKTIYFPTVEQFSVLLPPVDLQQKFEGIALKLADTKEKQEAAIKICDNLFSSLQQRAFNSELFTGGIDPDPPNFGITAHV